MTYPVIDPTETEADLFSGIFWLRLNEPLKLMDDSFLSEVSPVDMEILESCLESVTDSNQ